MQWLRRLGALTGAVLLSAGPAWAGDELVHVGCDELSSEQAAEVEARVRASLLTSELVAQQVRISCQPRNATVEMDSSWGTLAREVPTSALRLQDELVDAVDQLLHELSERRAQAAHALESEPAPLPRAGLPQSVPDASSALPPPLPAALVAQSAPLADAPSPIGATWITGPELLAEATAELWSSVLGLGGNVGFSHGSRSLRYGLSVGGATANDAHAGFGVNEWRARVELGWQPPWAAGFRGAFGFGPSLLNVTPKGDTLPRASTVSSAWFAELALLRPFWFGDLGLAPSVALRLFSAERYVNVDASQRFKLSGLSPALGLGVIYAVN